MSYWVFTDIFEENGPRMTPFHGGFGLINYEDLKKPAFYAFKFLNELGSSELVNADPASWACKGQDNSVQALFWDYTPIVPPSGMNDQQFYQHEIPAKDLGRAVLSITNLPAGSYSLEIYQTGYRANDVFTGYLDLGSPAQLTPAQVEILREQSNGGPESVETIQIETGKPFVRTFPMRQNDVYFVKLLPMGARSVARLRNVAAASVGNRGLRSSIASKISAGKPALRRSPGSFRRQQNLNAVLGHGCHQFLNIGNHQIAVIFHRL
jgi:xylan 1,4-beta-xylosidase